MTDESAQTAIQAALQRCDRFIDREMRLLAAEMNRPVYYKVSAFQVEDPEGEDAGSPVTFSSRNNFVGHTMNVGFSRIELEHAMRLQQREAEAANDDTVAEAREAQLSGENEPEDEPDEDEDDVPHVH